MTAAASLSNADPLPAFLAQIRRSLLDQRRVIDDALNEWAEAAPPDSQFGVSGTGGYRSLGHTNAGWHL